MGTKGDLAKAFATLISVLWNEQYTFLSPVTFRVSRTLDSERLLADLCSVYFVEINLHICTVLCRN
jgi:hypothetical protein